jgi:hypothetical protein
MYLGALTLSDLTTATGRSLDKAKLNGAISLISSISKWLTVNQEIPGRAEWALWKKANAIWSNPDGTLKQPLGEWYLSITNSRLIHFAYLHANTLYVRTSDGAYITNIRTQMNQFTEQGTVIPRAQIHPKATPVEVQGLENNQWILTHRATSLQVSLAQPLPRTFGEYILSLDPWEVDLLRHTELIHEPHTSCVALQNGFRAGSDGSEKFGTNGAFGWVIRNLEGHRVASGMGPSRGLVMNSYRAECSGMLAILRFLIRIAAYTDLFCTWSGTVGTDSQSMLDTLFGRDISSQNTMHDARSLPDDLPPLDPMIPEWDLLTEIRNTLRGLPFVQLVYVKGHQDNDKSYRQLSQMAQMNVDADHMAGRYQTELGRAHPFALMSPTTGAHLIYPEGTLTARYVTNIRRRATSSQLQQYIKHKYGFEDNVMQSINWSAHGKSMQLFIKKRVHITKMVHECLPTLGRLNRFDKGHRTCPCCPCLTEDRDHVIKCGAASRQRWRDKFLQEINMFHDKAETYPLLRHLWNEAIQEWLRTDEPDILVSPVLYHTDVREVIIQQNRIGWRQLINGRFSTAWSLIQEEYYRRLRQQTGTADRRSGETWQKQFIVKIWKQWEKLWKLRNEEVHGRDIETRAQAERQEIQRELREVYNNRNQMEPRIQELLYREEHQHMQRPLWVTRNWLATNAPVFRESMRRARTNATTGVRSIRSYFDPIR